MANQIAGTTFLSSGVGVTSAPIALDPTARTTALLLSLANLANGTVGASDITIQGTFDSWSAANPTQVWNNLSTAHYSSASGSQLITWTGPLAGVRLASSAWSTGAATGGVTLKALQAVTAGP